MYSTYCSYVHMYRMSAQSEGTSYTVDKLQVYLHFFHAYVRVDCCDTISKISVQALGLRTILYCLCGKVPIANIVQADTLSQRRYSPIIREQSVRTVQMYSNMYGRVWGWRLHEGCPQSAQSDGPVRFLIFCSISISLLASLVAGIKPQCTAGAD
jgi:hypothetical protein